MYICIRLWNNICIYIYIYVGDIQVATQQLNSKTSAFSSQAGVHIFSVVFNEGYESLWTNPLIGPNGTSLYRCGALFVDGGVRSTGMIWTLPRCQFASNINMSASIMSKCLDVFQEQRWTSKRSIYILFKHYFTT